MNRPEALNALSRGITADLTAAIERAVEEGARALVVTGEGRAFCAGGDLREMKLMWESEGRIEAFLEDPLAALHGLIVLIRETPIPFIAAVGGVCAGAGSNIALACDIVTASNEASFNEAFIRIGLSPDCGGSFFFRRAVGEKLAAELLMTGDTVTAERALEIGMINRVFPRDLLLEESIRLAELVSGRRPDGGDRQDQEDDERYVFEYSGRPARARAQTSARVRERRRFQGRRGGVPRKAASEVHRRITDLEKPL